MNKTTPTRNTDSSCRQLGLSLSESVQQAVQRYLQELDGESATGLHALVLSQVEAPLLAIVMQHTGNNQSRAAALLGLNRGTLRKKLGQHGLLAEHG